MKKNDSQEIFIDKSLRNWIFSPENLNINDFLKNDDVMLYYHLLKWADESYEPLSMLSRMFIHRNLLKSSDISFLNKIQRLEILAFARKSCQKKNYDSDIFCGVKEKSFRGFESNNSLKIWDGSIQKSLDNSSALIKTLIKPEERALIIYPGEIRDEIKSQISIMRAKPE